ncbi:hypothetical protein LguiA_009297 [Lonicera macranthoides]
MGVASEQWVVEEDAGFKIRGDSDDIIKEDADEQKSSTGWFSISRYRNELRWRSEVEVVLKMDGRSGDQW